MALRTGKPVVVKDLSADPQRNGERVGVLKALEAEGIRSLCVHPA